MSLLRRLASRSVPQLTRVAAIVALIGLAIMAYSVVVPRPLPVILAMSLGHVVGALALLSYLLAIVLDASRRSPSNATASQAEAPKDPAASPH